MKFFSEGADYPEQNKFARTVRAAHGIERHIFVLAYHDIAFVKHTVFFHEFNRRSRLRNFTADGFRYVIFAYRGALTVIDEREYTAVCRVAEKIEKLIILFIENFLFPVILDSSQIINRMFETKSVSLSIMYYFIDDFTNLNY